MSYDTVHRLGNIVQQQVQIELVFLLAHVQRKRVSDSAIGLAIQPLSTTVRSIHIQYIHSLFTAQGITYMYIVSCLIV